MNPLLAVLRAPHTVYLLGTSLIGRLPSAMAALAIVQLVRLSGGDYGFAGLMTALYIVAGAAGQPVLGRLVDRLGQTRVLLVGGAISFAAFLGMAGFVQSLPTLSLALAAIAGFTTPPLEPSLRSLWPKLVPPGPRLAAAFSLDAGAQEIIFILGPLLTVLGIAVFGAPGNIVLAGSLGLLGAILFALNSASRAAVGIARAHGASRSPLREPGMLPLVFFTFGVGLPVGALTIVATTAEDSRGIEGLAGWLLAANATGALIGATVVALRPLRWTPAQLLTACGVLLAIGYLPMAAVALPVAGYIVAALVSGLMLPPALGQIFERVSKLAPTDTATEANAWVVSAMTLGIGAGTLVAGAVVGASGAAAIPMVVVGTALATAALALLVIPRRAR